jgi:membrane-associated phospholipid phosphatase
MRHRTRAGVELTIGSLLVLAAVSGGLYFMVRPGPVLLDPWVFAALRPVHHSGLLVTVTRLGSPFVVMAAAGAGCLATLRRNWPRAVALLVGPVAAVVVSDWVMKPVVDRTYADVVSFPSGTVTAVAAVATVAVLATPDPWRSLVAALGGTVTVLEAMSVVALRWHYPTDALAGLAVGVGVVLLSDCAARGLATGRGRHALRPGSGRGLPGDPDIAARPDAEQTVRS